MADLGFDDFAEESVINTDAPPVQQIESPSSASLSPLMTTTMQSEPAAATSTITPTPTTTTATAGGNDNEESQNRRISGESSAETSADTEVDATAAPLTHPSPPVSAAPNSHLKIDTTAAALHNPSNSSNNNIDSNVLLDTLPDLASSDASITAVPLFSEVEMKLIDRFCIRSQSGTPSERIWAAQQLGNVLNLYSNDIIEMSVIITVAMQLGTDRDTNVRIELGKHLGLLMEAYFNLLHNSANNTNNSARNNNEMDDSECNSLISTMVPAELFHAWVRHLLCDITGYFPDVKSAVIYLGTALDDATFMSEVVQSLVLSLAQHPPPPITDLIVNSDTPDSNSNSNSNNAHDEGNGESSSATSSPTDLSTTTAEPKQNQQQQQQQPASLWQWRKNATSANETSQSSSPSSSSDQSATAAQKVAYETLIFKRKLLMLQLIHALVLKFGNKVRPIVFLSAIERTASDNRYEVRRDTAAVIGALAPAVSAEVAAGVLFPLFVTLSQDTVWHVREAVASQALPGLANALAAPANSVPLPVHSHSAQRSASGPVSTPSLFSRGSLSPPMSPPPHSSSSSESTEHVAAPVKSSQLSGFRGFGFLPSIRRSNSTATSTPPIAASTTANQQSNQSNSRKGSNEANQSESLNSNNSNSPHLTGSNSATESFIPVKQWVSILERLSSAQEPSTAVREAVFESIGQLILAFRYMAPLREHLARQYLAVANSALSSVGSVSGSSSSSQNGSMGLGLGLAINSSNNGNGNGNSGDNVAGKNANSTSGSSPEMLYKCAFNFPAVLYTLGRSRWDELRSVFLGMAKVDHCDVRLCIASALHEISAILGRDPISFNPSLYSTGDTNRAPLLPGTGSTVSNNSGRDLETVLAIFVADLDNIKTAVIEHLAETLTYLPASIRDQLLPGLVLLMRNGDHPWRLREIMANQIVQLVEACARDINASYGDHPSSSSPPPVSVASNKQSEDTASRASIEFVFPGVPFLTAVSPELQSALTPQTVMRHLLPLAVQWAKDPVASVRQAIVPCFSSFLRLTHSDPNMQVRFFETIIEFSQSRAWRGRMFFVGISEQLVKNEIEKDAFDQFFLPAVARLCNDSVVNVRIGVARVARNLINQLSVSQNEHGGIRTMLLSDMLPILQRDSDSDVQDIVEGLQLPSTNEDSSHKHPELPPLILSPVSDPQSGTDPDQALSPLRALAASPTGSNGSNTSAKSPILAGVPQGRSSISLPTRRRGGGGASGPVVPDDDDDMSSRYKNNSAFTPRRRSTATAPTSTIL